MSQPKALSNLPYYEPPTHAFRVFGPGHNMGRRGPRLNFKPLTNEDYPDDGGSDSPEISNLEVLPPLPEVRGLNLQQFLEIHTNGSCGD